MRINRVQSPNFGRLMIDPKAEEKLNKQSYPTVLELQKARQELKNTEFYHIYIGEDLKPRMVSTPKAYWGQFNSRNYGTKYSSNQMGPNSMYINEKSKHSLFEQYGITRGKEKDGLVRYRISGYNKAEQRAESLDSLKDDLGILTTLTLDFDKAAKLDNKGIVIFRTEQQIQDKIKSSVKELMKTCSTGKKEI